MTRTRLRCVLFASLFALSAQTARAQDPSFGDDGFAFAGFADLLLNFSSAEAVAVQGDGKIVVAGGARRSGLDFSDTAIVVARFNADGTLDTSFGNSAGRVVIGFNNRDFAAGVAVLPDGKILVGGSTAASSTGPVSVVLARLTPAGQLDLTFGVSGRVIREVGAVAIFSMKVLGNGRILFAGRATRPGTGQDFFLMRLLSTGGLDTSFGATGSFPNLTAAVTTDFGADERASAMAIQSDGRIVLVGAMEFLGDSRFAVARYATNGLLDTTFSGDGRATVNFVSDDHAGSSGDAALGVAIQGNGRIVVVGRAETDTGLARTDVAVARFTSTGNLDTTFGSGGRVTTAFEPGDPNRANEAAFAAFVQPDGRIVTAGFTGTPFNEVFGLLRYNANGTVDTTFGTGGRITTDDRGRLARAITTQSSLLNVNYIVTGEGSPPGESTQMTAARFFGFVRILTPIGSFDLGPNDATMDVHEKLTYTFTWTVPEPQNWHDLHSMELRIRDGADVIFWTRFDEATNTFSLFNEAAGRFTRAVPPGASNLLQTREATLNLGDSSVQGTGPTGPTVTLNLVLSFKPSAAGRTFIVEVAATDDTGAQADFVQAGTLTIKR